MSCIHLEPEISQRLQTNSQLRRFVWLSDWKQATGLMKIKCLVKARGLEGNADFVLQPAIQFAETRTDLPGEAQVLGQATMNTGDTNEQVFANYDFRI
jgi:hypothetical protein